MYTVRKIPRQSCGENLQRSGTILTVNIFLILKGLKQVFLSVFVYHDPPQPPPPPTPTLTPYGVSTHNLKLKGKNHAPYTTNPLPVCVIDHPNI